MQKQFLRICSFLVTLVMLVHLLPIEALAEEAQAAWRENETTVQTGHEDVHIVAEVTDKRGEYSKEYLLSNGLHMATVYPQAVHYNENGQWKDINNTLRSIGTGTQAAYANTEGIWDVSFPQQLSTDKGVSITKDGYTLTFYMSGELRAPTGGNLSTTSMESGTASFALTEAEPATAQIQNIDLSAARAEAEHPETIREGLRSRLQYADVYADTNIVYDLTSNQLKESIVMERYSSTLRGYQYTLNTGGLTPVLSDSGEIRLLGKESKEPVMVMPAPYLLDSGDAYSGDVTVELVKKGEQYILLYLLPQEWLADEDRQWPVILDPVVSASPVVSNIIDHSVLSEGWGNYGSAVLDCGKAEYGLGIMRTFVRFLELPELSASDVIVNAQIRLYIPAYYGSTSPVEVHRVTQDWDQTNMQFDNQAAFSPLAEDFAVCGAAGHYRWNVTNLVRQWYEGENYGVVFKSPDEIEQGTEVNRHRFRSSEYNPYADEGKPTLLITFRSNNGLESYWDYTSASAGRAGTGYISNYTGNLVWVRNDMGFGGCIMPVSISHIYNSNDSEQNEFSMGSGWRTNYNQIVYQWLENDSYYVWEDQDGTAHYFLYESEGVYKDEDGLELTLTVTTADSGDKTCVITDKFGNTSHFDQKGRLAKQENNQNFVPESGDVQNPQRMPSSITVSYIGDSMKIQNVIDSAGRIYRFTYSEESGLLANITYILEGTGEAQIYYTVCYEYENGNLVKIIDNDKSKVEYTYREAGEGEIGNLLISAEDVDGYVLTYAYSSVLKGRPARVQRISETHNGITGSDLALTYQKNQTTFTDHNENVQIMQFNNLGNTVSVQDDHGRAQYAKYAINDASETGDADSTKKANQLTVSSKLQNTVVNLLRNSSFEESELWSAVSGAATVNYTAGVSYIGSRSLMINCSTAGAVTGAYSAPFTADAGETYTFSAWVKTGAGEAYLALNDGTGNVTSEILEKNQDWTRLQVSYTAEAQTTLTARVLTEEVGTVYLDCVQVEKAPTASRYNLIQNSDFRHSGFWTSSLSIVSMSDSAAPELNNQACSISGIYNSVSRISQDVPVSGGEGDSFVLGGWAKADSVPLGELFGNKRQFSLIATFYNGATQVGDSHIIQFNPYLRSEGNWQSASAPIVATGDFTKISVELAYDFNMNTAWFDGIQLFREEFGTSYAYDNNGNVTAVQDIQRAKTVYQYNKDTNDLTGVWLNVRKDEAFLEDEDIPAREPDMTYTYDACHNVLTSVSREGITTAYEYDQWGNNTQVSVTGSGSSTPMVTTSTYSADGNRLLSTTDAAGNTTLYGYNAATNVLEWVQYPNDTESTRTEYDYDDETFRVESVTAAVNEATTLSVGYTYTDDLLTKIATPTTDYNFTYGNFALRSSIKVGTQTLASYDYTDDGNFYLERLAYGNEDSVQYTYDDQGRVTAQTWEDGDTVTYRYDNTGALATVTDSATGHTTTYYYDFTNRLMKYVESGEGYSHSVGYEYDEINNLSALVEVINGVEHSTAYTYDDSQRLTSITNGDTVMSICYDDYGRVIEKEAEHGNAIFMNVEYAYREPTSGVTTTGQVESLYTYSRNFSRTYTYTYDANGNILSVSDGTNTTSYTYDTAGQLLRENNQAAGKTWVWTYDNAGNILSRMEYAYTTGTLGAVVDTVNYGYNNANWGDLLTSYNGKTITYDEIGNPVNDGTWAYSWEHGRQLASMNNEKTTLEFKYNSDGLRTQKVVTTTSDHVHTFQDTVIAPTCTENGYTLHSCICGYIYQDSPVAATGHTFTTTVVGTNCTEVGHTVYTCACGYYYEDGSNGHDFTTLVVEPSETINGFTLHQCDCGYSYQSDPVASLAGASNTVDVISNTKVYDYVYNGSSLTKLTITTTITGNGTSTEELYFTYDGSSPMTVTYGDDIFYYVTNLQGDVIAILNDQGAAVVEYTYDAWGNILRIDGSKASDLGIANPLTYRGYVYDDESGLYYLQSRYYDPEVGRFINADGLVSTGQGLLGNNMFAYCNNNPVSNKDPRGDFFFTALGALTGFVSGVITATIHNAISDEKVDVFESGLHGAIGGAIAGAGVDVALLIVGSMGTAAPVVALAGTVAYVAGGLGNMYTTYASSGGTASDKEMVRSFHIGGLFNLVSLTTSWSCQASTFDGIAYSGNENLKGNFIVGTGIAIGTSIATGLDSKIFLVEK